MKTQIYAAPAVKGLNMLNMKRDINHQDFKIVDLRFVKSDFFSIA